MKAPTWTEQLQHDARWRLRLDDEAARGAERLAGVEELRAIDGLELTRVSWDDGRVRVTVNVDARLDSAAEASATEMVGPSQRTTARPSGS